MVFNWMIEAIKWKTLLKGISNITLMAAFRAIMSGVTVSIFTPNRIGEFAGRIFHLNPYNRIKGALASVTGSMSQLLVTIIIGSISLFLLHDRYINISEGYSLLINSIIFLLMIFLIWIYFNLSKVPVWLPKSALVKKIIPYINFIKTYNKVVMGNILILSFMRYAIFTIQYVLILKIFTVDVPVIEMIQIIALTYLVTAMIPSFALSELALKGTVAMHLFTQSEPTSILAASVSIWIINIVLPGIIGAFTTFYFKMKQ